MTHTRTHTSITFANPYLTCDECGQPVPRWHNPDACGCAENENEPGTNLPCGHKAGITSTCPSWSPVEGCECAEFLGRVDHPPAPTPA